MATSADVPWKYDVVINGVGFICAPEEVQAQFGYTPTFVPRSNVTGDYGDNFQDFWMTLTQRDFSLGEKQKYFRLEGDQARRFWRGERIDARTVGQVSVRPASPSLTFAASIAALSQRARISNGNALGLSSTNLYEIDPAGAITDRGAHGVTLPTNPHYCMTTDGVDVYIAHQAGVRKWDGTTYSAFSATAATAVEFLNNTLYGLDAGAGLLRRYDTAGTATTIGSWLQADGGAQNLFLGKLKAYGGKLLILLNFGIEGSELWEYDGTGIRRLHSFPKNFVAYDLDIAHGVVHVGGGFVKVENGNTSNVLIRPAVQYYVNGTQGLLWQADDFTTSGVSSVINANYASVSSFDGGLIFNDDTTGRILFYDPSVGGVHCVSTYTVAGGAPLLAAYQRLWVHARNSTTGYYFPDTTSIATSATLTTSLFDGDSTLTKIFRGIVVDFDAGTGGNGGSVDIAYRVGDVAGAYTTLQTGAASGTEYTLANTTGRSLSVKVTLNKGTSTTGPVLKRVSVRAVVQQTSFRKDVYVLALNGEDGRRHGQLRDTTADPLDAAAKAALLRTAATNATPIAVTDEFGTYTGVIEADGFQIRRVGRGSYIVVVPIRSV